jgi:molybdopterin converting factor small subunit
MKVRFELLALFRAKAGAERLEVEVPASAPTVLAALQALSVCTPQLGDLLRGEQLRDGVLVFAKEAGGATRRVLAPAAEAVQAGQVLVLSTAMGGG